jgi:hypothetical protein
MRNSKLYALENVFCAQSLQITKAENYFYYLDLNDVSADVNGFCNVINFIRYITRFIFFYCDLITVKTLKELTVVGIKYLAQLFIAVVSKGYNGKFHRPSSCQSQGSFLKS